MDLRYAGSLSFVKEVDQGLAVLMVILGSLMVTPIFFMNSVTDAAALLFARGGEFVSTFDKPQRDAFAMLFLRLHHYGDLANEIFWGLWLLPFGLLVYKSRFLPRVLGAWLMIACFAYLACSVAGLLFPAYEDKVINYTQPVLLAEVAIILWLTIIGRRNDAWLKRPDLAVDPRLESNAASHGKTLCQPD